MIPLRITPAKVLLATAALLVPAGIGAALATGSVPSSLLFRSASDTAPPSDWGGTVLETFKGEIEPGVVRGTIDFRILAGNVYVVAHDEPTFEVSVLAEESKGQQLGDAELEIAWSADTEDDAIHFILEVTRTGEASVVLGGESDTRVGVVAYVPNLNYETLSVCSGADWDHVFSDFFDDGEESEGCAGDGPKVSLSVGLPGEESSLKVPFALENLHGGSARVLASYANLELKALRFEAIEAVTNYGNLAGTFEAGTLRALTNYGNMGLKNLSVANLAVMTNYGNADVGVERILEAGEWELLSNYGNVALRVPVAGTEIGYDIFASANYGDVTIKVRGVEEEREEEDEKPGSSGGSLVPLAAPLAAALDGGKCKRGGCHGETVHAASTNLGTASLPVKIEAATNYGNILVTDGTYAKKAKNE